MLNVNVFINNLTNRLNKSFLFQVKEEDGLLTYVAGGKNTVIRWNFKQGNALSTFLAHIHTKCCFEGFWQGQILVQAICGTICVGGDKKKKRINKQIRSQNNVFL